MLQYWPQIIYVALVLFGIGVSAERTGKPKTGNYSFVVDFVSTIIGITLLYFGGFFK